MKTLIIGGGLSGLALADTLESRGHDYLLVEARPRFGGRIMTERQGADYFDMGPAWFWAGQPRIASLVERLNLAKFEQFSDGELTFETAEGQVQRGQGFSSMQGSWRLDGGLAALTSSLANRIPVGRKRLNAPVARLEMSPRNLVAKLASGEEISTDQVVLALPPRLAAQMAFAPDLTAATIRAMQAIPTWMAGQAKAVAVYDRPFWRENGLSGDAMSRMGPMVEIHDASPLNGNSYALFGFIGVPPDRRTDESLLRHHLLAQLERLFGPQAALPKQLYIKDWAADPDTATDADKSPLYAHPTYELPRALMNLWDGRLHFAGSEVAPTFGGYVEGALEAAENAVSALNLERRT